MDQSLATRQAGSLSPTDMLFDPNAYAHGMQLAEVFCNSDLVPAHFKGKKNDTFIALMMARRLGADPMMTMQNTYVIHGRPALTAKFAHALAKMSGKWKGEPRFEYSGSGDSRACTVRWQIASSGDVVEQEMSVKVAKAQGWWQRKGSPWPQMTDLMLSYRALDWLISKYTPEVKLGMHTVEETQDFGPDEREAEVLSETPTIQRMKEELESKPEDTIDLRGYPYPVSEELEKTWDEWKGESIGGDRYGENTWAWLAETQPDDDEAGDIPFLRERIEKQRQQWEESGVTPSEPAQKLAVVMRRIEVE